MSNLSIVGLQWGDEGKGKIVDVLTEDAQVIVRYCGGANAGHSVQINGKKFATHLLPVGVLRPGVMNYLGNGIVLDPEILFREINTLEQVGIRVSPANLKISYKAHVVMPWHKAEDGAKETSPNAIGTTKKGIGPAYADKMQRTTAIRVADLLDENILKQKIAHILSDRNAILDFLYLQPHFKADEIFEFYKEYGRRIKPFVDDVSYLLHQHKKQNHKVVFEGAHGVLLDVDHGTYPYVTSSNCTSLGVFSGAGVPPQFVDHTVGVVKAYSTRVGAGALPTEIEGDLAIYIRERGREYGTTTGRPRRIGWFDAVAAKYSVDLCGCSHIAITLLDVLTGIENIKICTGYQYKGQVLPYFTTNNEILKDVECVYETLPGWEEPLGDIRYLTHLPKNALNYVDFIQDSLWVRANVVSVGPGREQTIMSSW